MFLKDLRTNDVKVTVLSFSLGHIDTRIKDADGKSFRFLRVSMGIMFRFNERFCATLRTASNNIWIGLLQMNLL